MTRVTMILATLVALAAPAVAQPEEPGLLLAGASYHAGGIRGLNEFHPALGVQTHRWSAGLFQNSDGNPSAWAARRWTRGRAFLEAGLAANYDISPVLPMVRAGVSFRHAEVFAMPAYGENSERVGVAIVVQIRLDAPRGISRMLRWPGRGAQ